MLKNTRTSKTKKVLTVLLTLVMVVGFMPLFSGVHADAWYQTDMNEWHEKELLKGDAQGDFRPADNITRAEFMAFINRMQGYTEKSDDVKNYVDVKESDWFYADVAVALKAGYIKGISDTEMKPKAEITRQEAMLILQRIAGVSTGLECYKYANDSADVSGWARKGVSACINSGFVSGTPEGNILPLHNISRAQAVVMLNRKLNDVRVFVLAGDYDLNNEEVKNIKINGNGVKLTNVKLDKEGTVEIATNVSGDVKIEGNVKEDQIKNNSTDKAANVILNKDADNSNQGSTGGSSGSSGSSGNGGNGGNGGNQAETKSMADLVAKAVSKANVKLMVSYGSEDSKQEVIDVARNQKIATALKDKANGQFATDMYSNIVSKFEGSDVNTLKFGADTYVAHVFDPNTLSAKNLFDATGINTAEFYVANQLVVNDANVKNAVIAILTKLETGMIEKTAIDDAVAAFNANAPKNADDSEADHNVVVTKVDEFNSILSKTPADMTSIEIASIEIKLGNKEFKYNNLYVAPMLKVRNGASLPTGVTQKAGYVNLAECTGLSGTQMKTLYDAAE